MKVIEKIGLVLLLLLILLFYLIYIVDVSILNEYRPV